MTVGMGRGLRSPGIRAFAAVLGMALLGQASPCLAQSGDLVGVWQIEHPTDVLRPAGGKVPFTAEGKATYRENARLKAAGKYDDYDITTSRCSSPGVPRLMINPMRFKIREMYGVLTFDFEWNRAIRQVDTRGLPIEKPLAPRFTGVSTGKWEGNTLVVQTTDVSPNTLIDEVLPHSFDMVVTERYRLLDADTLENRITIQDPEYYSRPWEAVVTYKRQPFALLAEHVCMDSLPPVKGK